MPVIDHPIHPSTQHGPDARWGCWNRPRRRDPMLMKDGHLAASPDGLETVQRWRIVPDFGSLECRNDVSLTDPRCTDCEHRGSGEAYTKSMIEKSK